MRSIAVVAAACLLGTASPSEAEPVFSCDGVFNRPAILEEHVQCAGPYPGEQLAIFFKTEIWPNTYDTRVGDIQDAGLRQLAQEMGLKAGDHVPVVAKPKPAWLKTKWTFRHSSQATRATAVPLACVVGPGKGHAELSREAAKGLKWQDSAASLLALSSLDADDLEWENLAAHALTPAAGTPGAAAGDAISAFETWLKLNLQRVASECAQGRFGAAVYVTGYVLHSIQDLALHSGMTRNEQAALIATSHGAENDPRRVALAGEWTKSTLKQLEKVLPEACVTEMKKHPTTARPPLVASQYFGKQDRSAAAMQAFQKLGQSHPQTGSSPSGAWFASADRAAAKAFYDTHVRDVIAASLP